MRKGGWLRIGAISSILLHPVVPTLEHGNHGNCRIFLQSSVGLLYTLLNGEPGKILFHL